MQEARLHLCANWESGRFSLCRRRLLFGEWLVSRTLITHADLNTALAEQVRHRSPSFHQATALQNATAMAQLLYTPLSPLDVGALIGELRVAREVIPTDEWNFLFPPLGDASTLLGEILVTMGVLSASGLQSALVDFQDTMWH